MNNFYHIINDMKQKYDDYKLTAVNYYVNNTDTMDNTNIRRLKCKKV